MSSCSSITVPAVPVQLSVPGETVPRARFWFGSWTILKKDQDVGKGGVEFKGV